MAFIGSYNNSLSSSSSSRVLRRSTISFEEVEMSSIFDEDARESKLEEFKNSKLGVKDLMDSGLTRVPNFFVLPSDHELNPSASVHSRAKGGSKLQVPIIDLEGFEGERRAKIVDEIRQVAGSWGLFYMVNHGVPLDVMSKIMEGIKLFHEQPKEAKIALYSRDPSKKIQYYSSFHHVLRTFLWKDSFSCDLEGISSNDIPLVCRDPLLEYAEHLVKLKNKLSQLLSEALGLDTGHLERINCMETQRVIGHYYPACPEPEYTVGTTQHSDPYFLTILSTNNIDGLQVLHQDRWIDVPPMEGALIGNIGDMLQLISNDLFKSAIHRVLARKNGPRLSVVCFFYPNGENREQKYGVLEKLVAGNDQHLYSEISFSEYFTSFRKKNGLNKALLDFRR